MNRKVYIRAALAVALLASAAAMPAQAASKKKPIATNLGSTPTVNADPLAAGFTCTSQLTAQAARPLRIAVGKVGDFTGKFSNEASEGGFRVTQGGALMISSALGKLANVDQVERLDTQVADIDTLLAKSQLLRDGDALRGLTAGQYDGSDYYIIGGITEVNYNIRSGGGKVGVSNIYGGKRTYTMNVAADLKIVETKSLKVVKTISVQKQITGYENTFGLFTFKGDYLFDLDFGSKGQEPLQLGVRSVLEYGTLELISAVAPNRDYYAATCRPYAEAMFGK
ncbi:putative transcription activator protein hfaB [Caulobacter phage CcrPW]|uniref:Putative transcription activator protein hfaB n=1 Tax=Caulobacter phage CcrPW TaxID=2283271 RepID=A0A385EAU8_9CAUD|nr:putative transcription activator protein hfaB [Caulobacter phage CcrPW]AXQ68790.1 putative transcription activator protein hfaB [Caulobacter phage CcrPW]